MRCTTCERWVCGFEALMVSGIQIEALDTHSRVDYYNCTESLRFVHFRQCELKFSILPLHQECPFKTLHDLYNIVKVDDIYRELSGSARPRFDSVSRATPNFSWQRRCRSRLAIDRAVQGCTNVPHALHPPRGLRVRR